MTPFEIEWAYVRRYTLVPALTAGAAIAALIAAYFVQDSAQALNEQLTANQSVMQEDYDALIDRRRIVDRYHRRYQQFSELGFVGMESRLDWIETLRASSNDLTLPRVAYIIEPQLKAIAPVESILAGDDIAIHVSKLELEMSLVHELDLLRFVDELQQNAPGLIRVKGCDLVWQADPAEKLGPRPNIQANCSVAIYSVITADVGAGATS
ncbi:MAG: hypothetical protein QNJ00_16395 [Woeseiaceae bacterium]|nr:hypothetical protein [Woeseiaceae bacterium]